MDFQTSTKPWEAGGSSSQSSSSPFYTDKLHSAPIPFPGGPGGGGGVGGSFMNGYPMVAPPVPPRPTQTRPIYSVSSNYNPYSTHSGYTSSPYYYNNPYSNFNSSRHGNFNRMSHYGPVNNGEQTSIAELAEESSASAFHSIESFVNAFGSISSMLESTFHAVYSSFRAVVEVADHLGRVKEVFHTLAIFRFLRWIYKRILYLIGISKIKPEQIEAVWNSVSADTAKEAVDWSDRHLKQKRKSTWPIIVFLGFIFAGPYLIWKLLASFNLNKKTPNWATGEGDHFIAIADYDFEPASEKELRLRKGNRIRLAPASHQPEHIKGWVLASDGNKIGLVPVNYIKVMGKGNGSVSNQPPAIVRPESPPIIPPSSLPHFPVTSSANSPSISRSSSQSTLKWTDQTPLMTSTEEV